MRKSSPFVGRGIAVAVMAALVVVGGGAAAQAPRSAQSLFESGQYEDALRVAREEQARTGPNAASIYLTAQALQRLERANDARTALTGLAKFGPTWTAVGESDRAVLAGNRAMAVEAGKRAVALSPNDFHAHYQLGLALRAAENWQGSAEAFERAATIAPTFAYAHYYAGLSYSRVQRIDRTAEHFQYFLKLAPMAPERLAVESIMRTLRGR